MARTIYVSDEIGEVEFPDDMDDRSIADALHNNFPELGPNPYAAKETEKPVSRTVMDPDAYWQKTLGTDNPPPPNIIATGGAGATLPEPDSDAQRNMDATYTPGPALDDQGRPGAIPTTVASAVSGTAKMIGSAISETPEMAARAVNLGSKLFITAKAPQLAEKVPEIIPVENNPLLQWARDEGKAIGASTESFARTHPDTDFAKSLIESERVSKEAVKSMRLLTEKGDVTGVVKTVTDPKSWGVFLGQAVPSIAAMIATNGNMGVIMWMEAMEASSNAKEFEKKTGTKLSDQEYAQAVIQSAAINGVLEKIGFTKIQQAMKAKGISGKFFASILAAITEGTTEFGQGRNTKLAEKIAYNPDMTLDEIMEGALAETMGGIGAGASFSAGGMIGESLLPPPEPVPAPTEDELSDIKQSLDAQDLQEFMNDERPADEIISEKKAVEEKEIEQAAQQEEITAEAEAIAADMADQQQQSVQLEQGLAQAEADGQIVDETVPEMVAPPEGTGIVTDPVKVELPEDVDLAANQSDPDPTDAQKEAGNYKKGHLKLLGLDVTIENKRGDTRSGFGPDGKPWSVVLPAHYGYLKGTVGADSKPGAKLGKIEQVDVYVGENPTSKEIFFVDQIDPKTGNFDEAKVILGTNTIDQAASLYQAGFSDGTGASRMGAITPMKVPQFKNWLKNGNTKKAFRYKQEKAAKPNPELEQVDVTPAQGREAVQEPTNPQPEPRLKPVQEQVTAPSEQPQAPVQRDMPGVRAEGQQPQKVKISPVEVLAPKPIAEAKAKTEEVPVKNQENPSTRPVSESQAPATPEPSDAAPRQESVTPVSIKEAAKNGQILDMNGNVIPPDLSINIALEVEGSKDPVMVEVEAAQIMSELRGNIVRYEQLQECLS